MLDPGRSGQKLPEEGDSGRARRRSRFRQLSGYSGEVTREQFERIVEDALRDIPEPFRSRMENVGVVVEERPHPELLRSLGMSHGETLLGLYQGVPLTERGDWYNLVVPDKITLYRRPIMAACRNRDEIRQQVKSTVLHEVAHFYGIDDDQLDRMGYS